MSNGGKREFPECVNQEAGQKTFVDLNLKITKHYHGYTPPSPETEIDVIDVPVMEEEKKNFFQTYVLARRPCKIVGISPKQFPIDKLKPHNIMEVLPSQEILTIEKKSNGGFGSGTKRIKMSFGQFMEELVHKQQTALYLTTQYYEDDPNNSDYSTDEDEKDQILDDADNFETSSLTFDDLHDDFNDLIDNNDDEQNNETESEAEEEENEYRLKELYQPPLTNLIADISPQPEFLDYLIPQQINLWIGAVSNAVDDAAWLRKYDSKDATGKLGLGRNVPDGGSSSGLHHDHADNLYIPISGYKRFTLFSPHDAGKMYTVGNIRHVFESGVIDYFADSCAPLWRQLRDDGAIVAEVYKSILDSDSECSPEDRAKYKELISADSRLHEKKFKTSLDPPSFSTIPTAVVHLDKIAEGELKKEIQEVSMKKWPLFFQANRITVDVQPGEMLFLPTGWFHEVTSFGGDVDENNVHIAANYWFIPPNGKSMDKMYSHDDNYWPNDYRHTERALNKILEK